METQNIRPNLMVHAKQIEGRFTNDGAQGVHVGTVDHMEGSTYIKLKRSDSVDGKHHWIPVDWVTEVDDKAVYLNKTAEEFSRDALSEKPGNLH